MMRKGRSSEIKNIAYIWMEFLVDLSTKLSGEIILPIMVN